jgi:hypothetical protein
MRGLAATALTGRADPTDLSALSDAELESALSEWAGHLAAGEALFRRSGGRVRPPAAVGRGWVQVVRALAGLEVRVGAERRAGAGPGGPGAAPGAAVPAADLRVPRLSSHPPAARASHQALDPGPRPDRRGQPGAAVLLPSSPGARGRLRPDPGAGRADRGPAPGRLDPAQCARPAAVHPGAAGRRDQRGPRRADHPGHPATTVVRRPARPRVRRLGAAPHAQPAGTADSDPDSGRQAS